MPYNRNNTGSGKGVSRLEQHQKAMEVAQQSLATGIHYPKLQRLLD